MYSKPISEVRKIVDSILFSRKEYHRGRMSQDRMLEICTEKGTDPDVILYFLTTPLNLTCNEIETLTLTLPNKWGSDNEWENPTYKEALFRLKGNIQMILPNCRQTIQSRLKD